MATPKKARLDEDSVTGYIQCISPMKTSRTGNMYFNAKLQEKEKVTDVVGYRDKMRQDLKQMESQRTPVKLSPVQRVPSFKTPGNFDVKLTSFSHLSPAQLDFSFEKIQESKQTAPVTTIKNLKDAEEGSKVSISAKVLQRDNPVLQKLKRKLDETMTRTSYIVADDTGSVEITLWGPPDQVLPGNSYTFTDMTVKFFEKKKLSSNPDTSIKKIDDLKNISEETIFKAKEEVVEVVAVKVQTVNNCNFCNTAVVINEKLSTVKCGHCERRQLKETIVRSVKTELTTKHDDGSISTYSVPSHLMVQFCGPTATDDDCELLLLETKKIKITSAAAFSHIITDMKMV